VPRGWIENSRLLQDWFSFGREGEIKNAGREIHSALAGEPDIERGISPLQIAEVDCEEAARSGSRAHRLPIVRCLRVGARIVAKIAGAAGGSTRGNGVATSHATLNSWIPAASQYRNTRLTPASPHPARACGRDDLKGAEAGSG